MRYVFGLLVCLSLPACAHSQSADAATPSAAETAPRILTTKELQAAVPGHSIGRANVPPHESKVEQFRKDGTYLMLGDNFQDPGKYTVQNNMLCIQSVSHKSMCRFLLVDQNGDYWFVRDLNDKAYRKVVISKH